MPNAGTLCNPTESLKYYLEPKFEGLRVLLVEDDLADTYLIKSALQQDKRVGEIFHPGDGAEALELLRTLDVAPDVAIIDLNMPLKDGFSLLVELSCREGPTIPKVVLTSSLARDDHVRSRLPISC
jgi:CheY-like chemotaxis protein